MRAKDQNVINPKARKHLFCSSKIPKNYYWSRYNTKQDFFSFFITESVVVVGN